MRRDPVLAPKVSALPLDRADQQAFGRTGGPPRLGVGVPIIQEGKEFPIKFGDSVRLIAVECSRS